MSHNSKIEYALRIGFEHFDTWAKVQEMIGFCTKAGIREVQITPINLRSDPSVFLPRRLILLRCRQLAKVMRTLRAARITPGYCIVRTFMATSITGKDYIGFRQGRMDMYGKTSPLHPCPLDAVYLDYIQYYYAALARTGPALMFVDDDFRYEYLGMGPTCFCPLHLTEFARRFGHSLTREELAAILEKPAMHPIKNDWMEFKRILLVELARKLRQAVHQVNPTIHLGLMLTCVEISSLEGRDIKELVEAFAGKLPPLVRPGQGCYADTDRLTILKGLTETVYQCCQLPAGTEIQAEVDFYPHSTFNKSLAFGFDFQIKANLACGLRKINIWPFGQNHVVRADHPLAKIIVEKTKVFNQILRLIPPDAKMCGVQVIYSSKAAQLRPQRTHDVKMYLEPIPEILWRWGIPWTFEEAPVAILTKDSFPMSMEDIVRIFDQKNVFLDAEALANLVAMNVSPLTSLVIDKDLPYEKCACELILNDPANGCVAGAALFGQSRLVHLRYRPSSGWRPLTYLRDLQGRISAPGILAWEKNGRRIVVTAGNISENIFWMNEIRQQQMQKVLDWLYGEELPLVVREAPDLCPILLQRKSHNGRKTIVLLNVSTAPVTDAVLEIRTSSPKSVCLRYITDEGQLIPFPSTKFKCFRRTLYVQLGAQISIMPFQVRFLFYE